MGILADKRVHRVTLIEGDGIGPEVVRAVRRVVDAAGVAVLWDEQIAGGAAFRKGIASGVPAETLQSIRTNRVALKGPLATPVGDGEKSANVTLRKVFETYANVRPVRELAGVETPFSGRGIDLVIVRENVEDLYAGIEHQQTEGVAQCLKLMSRTGCEKVIHYAFALAVAEGRKSVHCATKANIMKLTEGLMKKTFEEIAPQYPGIRAQHIIIDNCAHELVRRPEQFEVIVTSNMNGDIVSDLASGLTGGLGIAPAANVGDGVAIFEAVHGTAPGMAGLDAANPAALLLSAVMMLRHLGELEAADAIDHALQVTLAEGARTADIARGDEIPMSTTDFTSAVIGNLGRRSAQRSREHRPLALPRLVRRPGQPRGATRTIGVDVFVQSDLSPAALGKSIETLIAGASFRLQMISNRGTKVYPHVADLPDLVDHFRCRLVVHDPAFAATDAEILDLVHRIGRGHVWMHIEKLRDYDGTPGFTRAQGEDAER